MTTYETGSTVPGLAAPPTWLRILLGIVLILAGIFVLGDVVIVTLISTVFIGLMAIVAGGFEIIHAFWTKGWGGLVLPILLGLLYIAFGIVLLNQPVTGALILTYLLGLFLLVSGVVRIVLGFRHWKDVGWTMLLSGALGILAGLVILTGWPETGLWVLGFVFGIDLIFHGIAWLAYAWRPAAAAV